MSNIDLLPWRARKRQQKKMFFFIKLFCLFLFTIFLGGYHLIQQQRELNHTIAQISKKKTLIEDLRKQSEITNAEINEKHRLATIKKRGEQLSKWLYHIAHELPHNAKLNSLFYDQKTLKIHGIISKGSYLQQYQLALSTLPGVSQVTVNEIKPDAGTGKNNFSLLLSIHS